MFTLWFKTHPVLCPFFQVPYSTCQSLKLFTRMTGIVFGNMTIILPLSDLTSITKVYILQRSKNDLTSIDNLSLLGKEVREEITKLQCLTSLGSFRCKPKSAFHKSKATRKRSRTLVYRCQACCIETPMHWEMIRPMIGFSMESQSSITFLQRFNHETGETQHWRWATTRKQHNTTLIVDLALLGVCTPPVIICNNIAWGLL